jgi:hypothetical protein
LLGVFLCHPRLAYRVEQRACLLLPALPAVSCRIKDELAVRPPEQPNPGTLSGHLEL